MPVLVFLALIKLDVLVMVDNSGSMAEEQGSMAGTFDAFLAQIDQLPGGRPDLHVAVISSNLGAGGYPITGCTSEGGAMHNAPTGTCTGPVPSDVYIADEIAADGTTRVQNFPGGDLALTFSCIAQLGITGCGFEQQLESVRAALDPANTGNAGFLRPDAYLAVLWLTDEDDCSASDTTLYDPNNATLGLLSSFRCTQWGLVCTTPPGAPDAVGTYTGCTAEPAAAYLHHPDEYATFLAALKGGDPGKVVLGAIMGDRSPVDVATDPNSGGLLLSPSCSGSLGSAAPGVRIGQLLDHFADSTEVSVCVPPGGLQAGELASAMDAFGRALREHIVVEEAGGPDAGPTPPDAAPSPDANPAGGNVDAGTGATGGSGGCCRAGGPADALLPLALAALLLRRRSRATRVIGSPR